MPVGAMTVAPPSTTPQRGSQGASGGRASAPEGTVPVRCSRPRHPVVADALGAMLARAITARAGASAADRYGGAVLLRATPIKDELQLKSELLTSNTRLESAFHNDPPLTPSDDAAAIAVLQEALEKAFKPLPNSHDPQTGKLDGKWGPETKRVLREYQTKRSIPPGGHEAGRRTLAALDADLKGGAKPDPKPGPQPKPKPPGCTYQPGEREQARKSRGDVEVNGNQVRLTGFNPGEAGLKPAHMEFLPKFIAQHSLDLPLNTDVAIAIGVTDCVSEEGGTDRALRLERARAVVKHAIGFAGAGLGRFQALDDPTAQITGDNATPAARARNRAVILTISKTPAPPEPGPQPKPKPDVQTFFFRVVSGFGGGEFLVGDFLRFQVVDFDNLLEDKFEYKGIGAGVGSPAYKTFAGKFTRFRHDAKAAGRRLTLQDVAGAACMVNVGGGPTAKTGLRIGRGFGLIEFDGETVGFGSSGTCGPIQGGDEPGRFDPKDIDLDDGA